VNSQWDTVRFAVNRLLDSPRRRFATMNKIM
jgi:hypothetical protein